MSARKITLQFAILSVAAKSEVAIEPKPEFSNLCIGQPNKPVHDASPLKAPSQCDHCGPIVDRDVLLKGLKSGGSYTIVKPEDIAEAKQEYTTEYKGVLKLVPHPIGEYLAKTAPGKSVHYLTPADAANADHYQLLLKLVREHPELAFVGLHTPVSATEQKMLTVRDGVLAMESRTLAAALKPAPSVGGTVNDAFYAMLEGSLGMFTTPYDEAAYEDRYSDALRKMIEDGETVSIDTGKAAAKPTKVLSDDVLMEKLRALQAVA